MATKSLFTRKAEKLVSAAGITINGDKPWDIQVHDTSAYRDALLKGTLGFGDSYTRGKWDVEQLDVFFEKLLLVRNDYLPSIVDFGQVIRNALINTQAGQRAFHVGQRHYDLGNDMYGLMLGESMGYSCGLYLKPDDDLTNAQYQKFDSMCQKLKLRPGMKVLEIGAGWGTFARHAAKNYGVTVVGLTVSAEQLKFAEKRCKGLPVSFLLLDYRNLSEEYTNYFDRVVSIEMIEAVGKKNFRTFFQTVARAMKDDGLFGLQAIVGLGIIDAFLSTRIFPNGLVPSHAQIVHACQKNFRIKSWMSFGKDYDRTLLDWDKNFRKNWAKIAKLKDDKGVLIYDVQFYRMWRYYLLCSAATFRVGINDDAQIIMTKPNAKHELK